MAEENKAKEYGLLRRVSSPRELKKLAPEELHAYCDELRRYIIEECSVNPGHLASSLGAVELIVAIHVCSTRGGTGWSLTWGTSAMPTRSSPAATPPWRPCVPLGDRRLPQAGGEPQRRLYRRPRLKLGIGGPRDGKG